MDGCLTGGTTHRRRAFILDLIKDGEHETLKKRLHIQGIGFNRERRYKQLKEARPERGDRDLAVVLVSNFKVSTVQR